MGNTSKDVPKMLSFTKDMGERQGRTIGPGAALERINK